MEVAGVILWNWALPVVILYLMITDLVSLRKIRRGFAPAGALSPVIAMIYIAFERRRYRG